MKKTPEKVMIDMDRPPKVLLLGNGVLRLSNNYGWEDLLKELGGFAGKGSLPDLTGIPYAMQPEAICGTDVEEVQRQTAAVIESQVPHEVIKQLVQWDFDAILTTNYTYEIEDALLEGCWNESRRRKCHATLYGSPSVRYNTCKCNLIPLKESRKIPVFHVHGEKARKHSLVLSYYSYAEAVYRLIEMNKRRKNAYQEHQASGQPLECQGWLDYFLMGDVYAVGFGFDLSEFDIWWAIERKSREHADCGKLHAYMIGKERELSKATMFGTMGVDEQFIKANDSFDKAYEDVLKMLGESLNQDIKHAQHS